MGIKPAIASPFNPLELGFRLEPEKYPRSQVPQIIFLALK